MTHNITVPTDSHFNISDLATENGCRRAFDILLTMPDEQLAREDIAVINLLCATGLPSTDPLDIPACLAVLDRWAIHAKEEIIRGYTLYLANPNPKKGSPNVYRLWALMHAIRIKSGLEEKLMSGKDIVNHITIDRSMPLTGGPNQHKRNSQSGFIHGLLGPRCLGSCACDPVLFAAIGRRLGFPVKLVLSVQHIFNRWVDDNEQFNMDGSMKRIGSDEDHHYVHRRRRWDNSELASIGKTVHVPLTPRQELAAFMFERAMCLSANLRFEEARDACQIAHRMSPDHPPYANELEMIEIYFEVRDRRKILSSLDKPQLSNVYVCDSCVPKAIWSVAGIENFILKKENA